ncbi:hypothetical protein [Pectobacterium phage Wc4-1]|uniref:Exonuclease n=1 Tax=Pectobacterium phage Wc4 TaxID=2652428 RepID=A0A5P8D5A3_9CAUD|nr:hypothetical protein [Pectobacterium phage Wc4]QFP93976.1 hypothetical protein [Pectobacterium phage Wc4-1]
MQEFIVTKLPDTVTVAYVDSDSIAYQAAFAVQKSHYIFTNTVTGEKSVTFPNAKQAKGWLEHQAEEAELFGFEFNAKDWVREKVEITGTHEQAIEATKSALKGWLKNAPKREWHGFLTEKGTHKVKDVKGLEKRYQGNRSTLVSPTYLVPCRDYLHSLPEMQVVKNGFEADAIVIASAEKKGETACLIALDKDLRIAEGTYIIDISYEPAMITIARDGVGGLWVCPIKSKPAKKLVKFNGCGFKWLCYQAVSGDAADGFGGLKGVGGAAVIKALEGCKTHKDCLTAIYETFYKPHGQFNYESWDGQDMSLTPLEMMKQHFSLPYMEKSAKDSFNFERYGWTPNE